MKLSVLKPLIAMGASMLMCVGLFITHSLDVNANIKQENIIETIQLDGLDGQKFVVDGKTYSLHSVSKENHNRIQAAVNSINDLNQLFSDRSSRLENKLHSLEHSINQLEEKSLHWSIYLNEQSLHLSDAEFEYLNKALDLNAIAIEKTTCEIEKALNQLKQKSKHNVTSHEVIGKHQKHLSKLLVDIAENS